MITTVAIVLGITTANVFQPGSGIDMSQLAAVDISKYQSTTAEVQSHAHGLMGTILSLVPTNIVASMAKGDMLPIIFFSVLFGFGLSSLPATHREPLVTVFRSISETMFKVTHGDALCAGRGVCADFGDRCHLWLRSRWRDRWPNWLSGLLRDSFFAGGARDRGAVCG